MIDITIDNNEVTVEGRLYHSFNDRVALGLMLTDVIDKAKYSGESITLWKVNPVFYGLVSPGKKTKDLIKQW